MTKTQTKTKVLKLRKQGNSIGDISRVMGLSKSTVSLWCRDTRLSDEAVSRLDKKTKQKSIEGLRMYSESRRKKRIIETAEDVRQGRDMLGALSSRDVFCIGIGLYWGEGYKKGSQEFGFTNSDPEIILFYIKWLQKIFGIKRDELILRVSINSVHSERTKQVELYWSNLTKVPLSQFTRTSLIKAKTKKVYDNADTHMGTLRIKVRKGTRLRRRVLGAIKAVNN